MKEVSPWVYILGTIAFYVVSGALISATDRRIGKRFFSWLEKWTGDPNSPPQEKGFIYNRSKGVKWIWAFIFATLTDAYLVIFSGKSVIVELATVLVESPLVYIGFMFGPWMNKLIQKRKRAVEAFEDVAEKVASGELKKDLIDGIEEVRDDIKDAGSAFVTATKEKVTELKESAAKIVSFGKSDDDVESPEVSVENSGKESDSETTIVKQEEGTPKKEGVYDRYKGGLKKYTRGL